MIAEISETIKDESERHAMRNIIDQEKRPRADDSTDDGSHGSIKANKSSRDNPDIDGGWAWMVAIGMAIFYFTIGGFFRSFGVLYAAILDTYDKSASETALIPGVRAACMIFLGPISTTLSQRTSERAMIITGAIITTSGFVVSFFATSLGFLIGSIGLVPGIGTAILAGPGNIMLGKYFNKRRATAMSLTSCVGCVGQITVPLLMVHLIEAYSVRGALLIYGGVVMHTLVTGMVMRPMSVQRTISKGKTESTDSSNPENKDTNDIFDQRNRDKQVIQTESRKTRDPNRIVAEGGPKNDGSYLDQDVEYIKGEQAEFAPLRARGDSQNKEKSRIHICCSHFKTFLHDLFYYELLLEPSYLIVLIASTLSLVMLLCQRIYLFAMAESLGYTREQSAMFLSIFGGADMAGRLAAGLLSDGKCMKPLHVMAMGCFLSGTAFCVVPLATSLYSMIPLVIGIGGFISTNIVLVMPVLVASLGMEWFPKAFSMLLFFHGITGAVTPPLLGLIKDFLGIYGPMFPLTGGLQILSGLLLLLEPLARKMCTREQEGSTNP